MPDNANPASLSHTRAPRVARTSPLLLQLLTVGDRQVQETHATYDGESAMSRLVDGSFAIDARDIRIGTKKRDVEKGEDQKDRW
jgi:hypothetical protein